MRTFPDRAGAILSRLLRPDRHPVLQLIEDQPLTVADILAATPQPTARTAPHVPPPGATATPERRPAPDLGS